MRHRHRNCILVAVISLFLLPATGGARQQFLSTARVTIKGRGMLEELQRRGFDILSFSPRDGTVDVAADDRQIEYLFSLGVPVSVVTTPEMLSAQVPLDDDLGLYHTYAEMEAQLGALVATYPGLAEQSVIGTSIEGRNIYALKVSDNVGTDESEPEVLIAGNHHARELMSVDIPLRFAIYLLDNYGIDPDVTNAVDSREIYFVPMINPDGHVYVENNHAGSPNGWWRKNRRLNPLGSIGVDLNRNYSYQWGYDNMGSSSDESSPVYRGTGPFSEPETQAIRDFCAARSFTVGLSYHSYGELLLFPWGYYFGYTTDHEVFAKLGEALASTNGYFSGNPAMGAIYLTNGDSDDWAYGDDVTKPSFFLYTPEVNTASEGGFGPPDSLIQPTFDLLLPMNMTLLEYADNPYRVVGPYAPTLFAIDEGQLPLYYVLNWSSNDPGDPNPVVGYNVVQYENLGFLAEDGANAVSPWWNYNGWSVSSARMSEGSASYYSNTGDNLSNTLEIGTFYRVDAVSDTFSCQLWYDIETHWDYAYFEVSTDGGLIWSPVAGNVTTNSNPNGANRGNGITGLSGGWVQAIFPLDAYVGSEVHLRFNYVTDTYIFEEGIYVDQAGPVPTYDAKTTIASSVPGTSLLLTPPGAGTFTYHVQATDAEGDGSLFSNTQDVTIVNPPSGIGEVPVLSSTLGPNHPNPFNPVTHLPYAVGSGDGSAETRRVVLTIFGVDGTRIATLVDEEAPAGTYQAVWAGTDDRGEPVSSGVYFAHLSVGGRESFVRKLVLLK